MKYYFAFANGDPQPFVVEDDSVMELIRARYIGTWVRTGDEDHDFDRVIDIWTEDQVRKYFDD